MSRLALGQEKLTEAMSQLAWTVRDTQKQMGGLAQTAGYALEAYRLERLPKILAKHCGFMESLALPEVFRRPDGTADEIDVVLRGEIAGRGDKSVFSAAGSGPASLMGLSAASGLSRRLAGYRRLLITPTARRRSVT